MNELEFYKIIKEEFELEINHHPDGIFGIINFYQLESFMKKLNLDNDFFESGFDCTIYQDYLSIDLEEIISYYDFNKDMFNEDIAEMYFKTKKVEEEKALRRSLRRYRKELDDQEI